MERKYLCEMKTTSEMASQLKTDQSEKKAIFCYFLYCNYFNEISSVEISLNKVTHFLILRPIHMLFKNL